LPRAALLPRDGGRAARPLAAPCHGWADSGRTGDNARMNARPCRARVSRRSHGTHRMAEAVRHDKTARQLRLLSDALDSGRLGPVRRLVNTLAPAEIGNLLESLPPAKRQVVWGLVDAEDDGEVLVHVGDEVRESLLADMDPDEIVAAVE